MPNNSKIKSLDELAALLESERRLGKTIVMCHGVFDLMHPGHILHLREARKLGDVLVLTVTPDHFVNKGPGRPAFNQRLRAETLAALQDIDYVAINQWPTAVEAIHRLRPNIYIKGRDYADSSADITGNIIREEEAVHQVGGRIEFTDTDLFSSTALINRYFNHYPPQTEQFLYEFRARHAADEVIGCLQRLAEVRVLVIGEAILDRYSYCTPAARSPKQFVLSTKFVSEEIFAGGSLATANHVAGFCNHVTLITCVGADDQQLGFIRSKLRPNIRFLPITTDDRPTITKQRFVEPTFLTKLFETQYLDDTPLLPQTENQVHEALLEQLPRHDLVIISDFGHGLVTPRLRQTLYDSDRFLAVNTQTNSANFGYNPVTKYARADYVCVDEVELRLASGVQYSDFTPEAIELRHSLGARNFLVTRGPLGAMLITADDQVHCAPALATRIVDRVGAGDAVFGITSPCAYREYPPDIVNVIGNLVGAAAVEIVCNRDPVDPIMLYKFLTHLLK